jgi:hypothetical protein
MKDIKASPDDLNTLQKFSQQLHMYGPDQLRSALKMAISIARKAIELCSIQETSPQQPERRGAKRFPMYIDAEYYPLKHYSLEEEEEGEESIHQGLLMNISKTGLLLASARPLRPGSVLTILFDINWGEITGVPVGVVGSVVREQANLAASRLGKYHYYYGIKFHASKRVA